MCLWRSICSDHMSIFNHVLSHCWVCRALYISKQVPSSDITYTIIFAPSDAVHYGTKLLNFDEVQLSYLCLVAIVWFHLQAEIGIYMCLHVYQSYGHLLHFQVPG